MSTASRHPQAALDGPRDHGSPAGHRRLFELTLGVLAHEHERREVEHDVGATRRPDRLRVDLALDCQSHDGNNC